MPKDDAMVRRLFEQLESVFSDAQWARPDGAKRVADQKGWVPLVKVIQLAPIVEVLKGCDKQYSIQTVQHALKSHSSSLIQLHRNGSCIRRYPLKHRVRSQVEFLFGDENYARDLELLFMASAEGFVKVADLLGRPMFQAMLHTDAPTIEAGLEVAKSALGDSVLLELKGSTADDMVVRRRSLQGRVVRQVEFYLSEEHLHHDGYLNELMAEHGEGWIRLQDLLAFPRMKLICLPQVEAVAKVLLEHSDAVEVSEDMRVRPKWWALAMGLSGESNSESEADLDQIPPQSPMLPWIPAKAQSDFRMMTWNILADFLCRPELYPYADRQCLTWPYRKAQIIAEIARTRPQVLCLQEVQGIGPGGPPKSDHYTQLREELGLFGYDSTYIRKADMYGGHPGANLGNAIFWMKDTFALEDQHDLNYSELLGERAKTDATRWYFGSPQVAQILFLQHIALKKRVAVVNTHISCAWETPVKQLVQVQELMCQMEKLIPPDMPLILGGDMNSLFGSGAYRLVTEGVLSSLDPHAQIDVHDAEIGIQMPFEKFYHGRPLRSAYRDVLGGEPLFTNFTGEPKSFAGTLDYIFYSGGLKGPGQLTADCVMMIPSIEECQKEIALPNSIYPSDHLPLTACFSFSK